MQMLNRVQHDVYLTEGLVLVYTIDMINWKNELNSEQLTAVSYQGGPMLVLAGAGSGKTRVLTYRVAYMIEEFKVPSENILLLTFTNKAAGEMVKRVTGLTNQDIGFGGTFHSYCAKILRRHGYLIGVDPNYTIYDEDDRLNAIKMVMKEQNIDPKLIKAPSVAASISSAKNEMLMALEYSNIARGGYQEQVAKIWVAYEMMTNKFHALDFDDLLIAGVRLLETEEGKRRLQAQFSCVLVDEYQDTNKCQYKLTKLLVDNQEKPNLTVVGDFSQAIYSWRGADFRNLLMLERDYPKIKIAKLTTNYRSGQYILDAAYGVIENNTEHPILKLLANQVGGEKVKLIEVRDEKEEARVVKDTAARAGQGKVAVLYRTNAQSRAIEEELIKHGMPYTLVGGTKFYERKEIKDILAYLKVIANPDDGVSWKRIETVGKRRMEALRGWVQRYTGEQPLAERETSWILKEVLVATDYLSLYDEKDENDLMRLENIKELLTVASEFADLTAFLENVALVQSEAAKEIKEESRLVLSTIHAAKGLEFETVIIVGMEEGIFPHSRSLMEKSQMEEERRLCYVAMTRAKRELYLIYARNRLFFGQRDAGVPSRFLMEVPESTLERGKRRGVINEERIKIVSDEEVGMAARGDFAEIDSW
ncbi:hypothetical protein A2368_00750 [Candidatus Collierbacteria bacterium RIFOXYB1_FULL_49_13]|uniref:DNA 3'-5' helicase n=1 Tax=Candidatus Collierbacteria bacterium RIFOXYB1_FULL_49_13 TaxID=1817728 RepID=A0A1F5FF65_9BACT|nr:MAG: hypothetical protein A2368_00750 [Candidatus Collierbacteria bacterium RIFOXYB1_FULL_49_13]